MLKSTALKHFQPPKSDNPRAAVKAIAAALGISRQAVHKWPAVIPYWSALDIERVTRRKLRVRPDLYVRGKPALQKIAHEDTSSSSRPDETGSRRRAGQVA